MPSSMLNYSRNFGSYCRKCQPARPPPYKVYGPAGAERWPGIRNMAVSVRPAVAGRCESSPLVMIYRLFVVCF